MPMTRVKRKAGGVAGEERTGEVLKKKTPRPNPEISSPVANAP